jgi:integrase
MASLVKRTRKDGSPSWFVKYRARRRPSPLGAVRQQQGSSRPQGRRRGQAREQPRNVEPTRPRHLRDGRRSVVRAPPSGASAGDPHQLPRRARRPPAAPLRQGRGARDPSLGGRIFSSRDGEEGEGRQHDPQRRRRPLDDPGRTRRRRRPRRQPGGRARARETTGTAAEEDRGPDPGRGRALDAAARPEARPVFELAASVGLRRAELLALRWEDVDFAGSAITVRESKTAAGERRVPIFGSARKVLLEAKACSRFSRPEDYVFPTVVGTPENPAAWSSLEFYYARRRAKLRETLRFHDLRHYAVSRLIARQALGDARRLLASLRRRDRRGGGTLRPAGGERLRRDWLTVQNAAYGAREKCARTRYPGESNADKVRLDAGSAGIAASRDHRRLLCQPIR